jgi:hypothetical protein
MRTFASAVSIPLQLISSREIFFGWVRDALIGIEQHELDEWLTIDGERPFDPHTKAVIA